MAGERGDRHGMGDVKGEKEKEAKEGEDDVKRRNLEKEKT